MTKKKSKSPIKKHTKVKINGSLQDVLLLTVGKKPSKKVTVTLS